MLIIKKLTWNNWFSYGEDNSIIFTDRTLSQITGENGHGKSSIPAIIQEVLYAKNIRAIPKGDIANWNIDKPIVSATILFSVNNKEYSLSVERTSTNKATLLEDGRDISEHTYSKTLKLVERIMGMPFKVFSTLTYQSADLGLAFLTDTDTNRKAFLSSLFTGLDIYNSMFSLISAKCKDINSSISRVISDISASSTILISLKEPSPPTPVVGHIRSIKSLSESVFEKGQILKNISDFNNKIKTNNTAITKRDSLLKQEPERVEIGTLKEELANTTLNLQIEKNNRNKYNEEKSELDKALKLETTKGTCITCGQELDNKEVKLRIESINRELQEVSKAIITSTKCKTDIQNEIIKVEKYSKWKTDVDSIVINKEILDTELKAASVLKEEISNLKDRVHQIENNNNKITKYETDVKIYESLLENYNELYSKCKTDINNNESLLKELNKDLNEYTILKNAFSPKGLISYKLESLVKFIEEKTNEYLLEFSKGEFAIQFIVDKDKLKLNIIKDSSKIVSIRSLSAGQKARINVSTLLAIRSTMANITNNKVNILFLDEIMGVLDAPGKEALIEVLHKEKELNTFIVSHEYSHPLIHKIRAVMENNMSKIIDG